jgi:hypothetical protein
MRLDDLTVALRPRSGWEAIDLGFALVRQHAGRVWRPWFALTLPFFLLFNLLGWWLDAMWLAWLGLWWFKPLFDRVVLAVLASAVFGQLQDSRGALRGLRRGWRCFWPWLFWRRFDPGRSMLLPMDQLEAPPRGTRGPRRAVLATLAGGYGHAILLAMAGLLFEALLAASIYALVLMFVPQELLSEAAQHMWRTLFEHPPPWAQALSNLMAYVALSLFEPFYVGGGFGLYLNRRTLIEGWDLEVAFRRIHGRLRELGLGAGSLLLVLALALPQSASAQPGGGGAEAAARAAAELAAEGDGEAVAQPLREAFGADYVEPSPAFDRAVTETLENDPLFAPPVTQTRWVSTASTEEPQEFQWPEWLRWLEAPMKALEGFVEVLAALFAVFTDFAALLLLALFGLLLFFTRRYWLGWIREGLGGRERLHVEEEDLPEPAPVEPLPADLPAAVRRLWESGAHRAALALLYRGSVEGLSQRLPQPLPPGATEDECVRGARRLADTESRQQFGLIVRAWQAVAYAGRRPPADSLSGLLERWSERFGARA